MSFTSASFSLTPYSATFVEVNSISLIPIEDLHQIINLFLADYFTQGHLQQQMKGTTIVRILVHRHVCIGNLKRRGKAHLDGDAIRRNDILACDGDELRPNVYRQDRVKSGQNPVLAGQQRR
jgi:hypothetical protein